MKSFNFTDAEKNKINSNLLAIKQCLLEKAYALRAPVTIPFTNNNMRYIGIEEQTYFITISPDKGITGYNGCETVDFFLTEKLPKNTVSLYADISYALALITDWNIVKARLDTAIETQRRLLVTIANFDTAYAKTY